MELEEKILKHGDKVYFDWNDSNAPSTGQSYGRAGFVICLIWRYGRLKRFFIYPAQQRNVKYYYRIECNSDSFNSQSWTYKGIKEPKVWLHFWCKEHKCPAMRLHVPEKSKSFSIYTLSSSGINFDNE